jgi:hypothetical protein
MALSDYTIYISLHTTPTKQRKFLYEIALFTALQQGCKVVVICDFDTEPENIELAKSKGAEIIKVENVSDSGMNKVLRSIEHCKTKWCCILNDDDAYIPNRIRMIDHLASINPELNPAIIYTDVIFQQNGLVSGHKGIIHVKPNNIYHTPPSKWIINTELVKVNELPLLDEFKHQKWGWDYILALLILGKGDGAYFDNASIVYNIHTQNASNIIDQSNWMEAFIKDHPNEFKATSRMEVFQFL